jgi:hypothetical protein
MPDTGKETDNMAVYNDGSTFSIVAGEALPAYRAVLVTVDTGVIVAKLADAGDVPFGITGVAATASGEYAEVKVLMGRQIMTASEAIDIGEPVNLTADGKIGDATPGAPGLIGIAMETSTGSGDEIAVLLNSYLFSGEVGS